MASSHKTSDEMLADMTENNDGNLSISTVVDQLKSIVHSAEMQLDEISSQVKDLEEKRLVKKEGMPNIKALQAEIGNLKIGKISNMMSLITQIENLQDLNVGLEGASSVLQTQPRKKTTEQTGLFPDTSMTQSNKEPDCENVNASVLERLKNLEASQAEYQKVQDNVLSRLTELEKPTDGFSAHLYGQSEFQDGDKVIFETTYHNTGHFNIRHGIFTAPRDGTYFAGLSVQTATDTTAVTVRVVCSSIGNETTVCRISSGKDGHCHPGTNSSCSFFKMRKGDTLYAKVSLEGEAEKCRLTYYTALCCFYHGP